MKENIKVAAILTISFAIVVLSPFLGRDIISIADIKNVSSTDYYIFYNTRLPRSVMAFITGGILSIGGLVFQSLFKNPIATPYTLGVAGGASLGAAFYYFTGYTGILSVYTGSTLWAVFGAVFVIIIVYGISLTTGRMDSSTILLSGVAISFFCSALIMFIQYFADTTNSYKITRYMMGSLSGANYDEILFLLPISLLFLLITYAFHKELDLISIDSSVAESRGVNIKRTVTLLYFAVSISIAATVSITGPIGFVGMIVPHIIRMIVTSRNKILIPLSFISGGAFLTLCDTLSRIVISPSELPVAVITSLAGAPFFIFLIISRKNKYE